MSMCRVICRYKCIIIAYDRWLVHEEWGKIAKWPGYTRIF